MNAEFTSYKIIKDKTEAEPVKYPKYFLNCILTEVGSFINKCEIKSKQAKLGFCLFWLHITSIDKTADS